MSKIVNQVEEVEPSGFWLWVTSKKYYQDKNGEERTELEPLNELFWTCNEETRKGDLIFLYRTSPKTDVKYLLQATSDACEVIEGDEFSEWHHCDVMVIFKFEKPLLSIEMKKNEILSNSDPVKRNYQGNKGSFEFTGDEWTEINDLLIEKNPDYKTFIELMKSKKPILEGYF